MVIIKKRKKIIVLISVIAIIVAILIFHSYHPTHWKYNDIWIIGKTSDEITDRYGEFDRQWLDNQAYYEIGESLSDYIWRKYMGGPPSKYYCILFDENGYAQKVYRGSTVMDSI
jgi:hypothetical protein